MTAPAHDPGAGTLLGKARSRTAVRPVPDPPPEPQPEAPYTLADFRRDFHGDLRGLLDERHPSTREGQPFREEDWFDTWQMQAAQAARDLADAAAAVNAADAAGDTELRRGYQRDAAAFTDELHRAGWLAMEERAAQRRRELEAEVPRHPAVATEPLVPLPGAPSAAVTGKSPAAEGDQVPGPDAVPPAVSGPAPEGGVS